MIYCIAGLPCSGKTYFGDKLAFKTNSYFLDDPSSLTLIETRIECFSDIVIVDPWFCIASVREKMNNLIGDKEVEWLFFENNPQQCLRNYVIRKMTDDRKVEGLIHQLSALYVVPMGAHTIPVYRQDSP